VIEIRIINITFFQMHIIVNDDCIFCGKYKFLKKNGQRMLESPRGNNLCVLHE